MPVALSSLCGERLCQNGNFQDTSGGGRMGEMQGDENENEGAYCRSFAASAGSASERTDEIALCVRLALRFMAGFESRKTVRTERGSKSSIEPGFMPGRSFAWAWPRRRGFGRACLVRALPRVPAVFGEAGTRYMTRRRARLCAASPCDKRRRQGKSPDLAVFHTFAA